MPIAYDATSLGSGNTGTLTVSHTCSGSDRILFVHCGKDHTAISGITYAGVSLTKVVTAGSGGECSSMWMLVNPASGANNIVVSFTPTPAVYMAAASYTGAKQTGQPEQSTGAQVSGNLSLSITTAIDNCWAVIGSKDQAIGVTAGAGTTMRSSNISSIADGNSPKTPAGSYTLVLNVTGTHTGTMVSFAPSVASARQNRLLTLGVG